MIRTFSFVSVALQPRIYLFFISQQLENMLKYFSNTQAYRKQCVQFNLKHMKSIATKSTIIGLVVGVVMSINMMLMGIGGDFAYSVSLGFVLDSLPLSEGMGWIVGFLFFILLYTLYGLVVGLLIKKLRKG